MRSSVLTLAISLAVLTGQLAGASFTLGATIRAGLRTSGDWELGLGVGGSPFSATVQATPYFADNQDYDFTLSYSGAANQARLSVDTNPGLGPPDVVTWNPTGGSPSTAARLWTIASGGLMVSAAFAVRPPPNPPMPETRIRVRNLAFAPGITILSPLSITDIEARQQGATATAAVPGAVVFLTQAGSGDWTLSGTFRMRGLGSVFTSGAVRSELQFLFSATASDAVPEPATAAMLGTGLALMAFSRWRS